MRQIPIRLPQAATAASTPSNHSRMSNPMLRSSPLTNLLQYPTTDVGDASSPSSSLITHNSSPSSMELLRSSSNTSPIRRAEATAREAILGMTRLQQQQRTNPATDGPNRSPSLSRRVIINLNNNQSVSLDSRLSSAMKPPSVPSSSSRSLQRNNLYHVPVLHEIQMPSYPATPAASRLSSASLSASNSKNGQYKNECHIEIPVTFATSNDQENRIEQLNGHDDEIFIREPISSIKTLKSILKRSSSRDTVSRKNVSFMNA